MPIVPLKLPMGFYSNGTILDNAGKWYDGNLFRWSNDKLRNMPGWEAINETTAPAILQFPVVSNLKVRDIISLSDTYSSVENYFFAGTTIDDDVVANNRLYGVLIEGADATSGTVVSAHNISVESITTDDTPRVRWRFDKFGNEAVMLQIGTSKVLKTTGLAAPAIQTNSPATSQWMLVTDQRIVMCFGADGDDRLIKWSARENANNWTAASDNEAGDYNLPSQGGIVSACKVGRDILIVTEKDVFLCSYVRPPYVYSFNLIVDGISIISPYSLIYAGGKAYWIGRDGFYVYDGAVQILNCPIFDKVKKWPTAPADTTTNPNLSFPYAFTMTSWTIAEHHEIWWCMENTDTGETLQIIYNYKYNIFYTASIDRVAGMDRVRNYFPIMIDQYGRWYAHEYGIAYARPTELAAADLEPFVITGPLLAGNGDFNIVFQTLYPDGLKANDFKFQFYATQFSTGQTDDEQLGYTTGEMIPDATTKVIYPRIEGRQIRMKITARFPDGITEAIIGSMRADFEQGDER